MKILIANHALADPAGSETYVLTLTTELVRLGHEVVCFAPTIGEVGAEIRKSGARTILDPRDAGEVDVIHAHHRDSAFLAMAAWPLVPAVFVVHSPGLAGVFERPPLARQGIERWVAVSERAAWALRHRDEIPADEIAVVPNFIDLERFKSKRPARCPARRVLFMGNVSDARAHALVAEASRMAGLDVRFIGGSRRRMDVASEMLWADIVVTIGRGALEAAGCARPVVLLSGFGYDGLLTPETAERAYETNYNGTAVQTMPSAQELAEELARVTPELGAWSREWVEQHHDSKKVVPRLLDLYDDAVRLAAERLGRVGAERVLKDRYAELYPALRWWHRQPDWAEWDRYEQPLETWEELAHHVPPEILVQVLQRDANRRRHEREDELQRSARAEVADCQARYGQLVEAQQRTLDEVRDVAAYWQQRYAQVADFPPVAIARWARRHLVRLARRG